MIRKGLYKAKFKAPYDTFPRGRAADYGDLAICLLKSTRAGMWAQ